MTTTERVAVVRFYSSSSSSSYPLPLCLSLSTRCLPIKLVIWPSHPINYTPDVVNILACVCRSINIVCMGFLWLKKNAKKEKEKKLKWILPTTYACMSKMWDVQKIVFFTQFFVLMTLTHYRSWEGRKHRNEVINNFKNKKHTYECMTSSCSLPSIDY